MSTRMKRCAATAAALTAVAATTTACGSQASTTPSMSPSPTMMTAAQTAACTALLKAPQDIFAYQAASNGPSPLPPAATNTLLTPIAADYATIAAGTSGPAATSAAAVTSTINEVVKTKNYKLLDDDAYGANLGIPSAAGMSLCGWTGPTLTAMSHPGAKATDPPKLMFMDIPKTMTAGKTSITLVNKGKLPHELIVLPLKPTFTGGAEDLKKLDDKGFLADAAGAPTVAFAPPGHSGVLNVNLTPGKYAFFCHVPLMDKKGNLIMGAHGPIWHYTLGMMYLVTVS